MTVKNITGANFHCQLIFFTVSGNFHCQLEIFTVSGNFHCQLFFFTVRKLTVKIVLTLLEFWLCQRNKTKVSASQVIFGPDQKIAKISESSILK